MRKARREQRHQLAVTDAPDGKQSPLLTRLARSGLPWRDAIPKRPDAVRYRPRVSALTSAARAPCLELKRLACRSDAELACVGVVVAPHRELAGLADHYRAGPLSDEHIGPDGVTSSAMPRTEGGRRRTSEAVAMNGAGAGMLSGSVELAALAALVAAAVVSGRSIAGAGNAPATATARSRRPERGRPAGMSARSGRTRRDARGHE
jgi:hypothetical protein